MQPYQEAAKSLRQGDEYPLQLLKQAGLTAIGGGAATVGSKALTKLIPAVGALINQYVPEKFAIGGLNKIDPRFGKFIQGALDEGYSFEDVRSFIGDKLDKNAPAMQNQNKKNLIEQHSPELHQFIDQEIKKGRSPLQAGAIASLGAKGMPDFRKVIEKITKQHKMPWSSILESVYGMQQGDQNPPNQPQNPQKQPQQQGQGGPGQQALMDILSKINQKLGQ